MIAATSLSTPAVLPSELDQILADFAECNVWLTRIKILAAALDYGLPEDFAVTLADVAERMEPTS